MAGFLFTQIHYTLDLSKLFLPSFILSSCTSYFFVSFFKKKLYRSKLLFKLIVFGFSIAFLPTSYFFLNLSNQMSSSQKKEIEFIYKKYKNSKRPKNYDVEIQFNKEKHHIAIDAQSHKNISPSGYGNMIIYTGYWGSRYIKEIEIEKYKFKPKK